MLEVDVSEIHAYPIRPEGSEEPLFPTAHSKQEIAEHLLEAPWLFRASELEGRTGGAVHALKEPIRLRDVSGRVEIVRLVGSRRCRPSWRRRCVEGILDHWREVRWWWDAGRHEDRAVFRILLSGGAVVDVARERCGGWSLVGVVD